MPILTVQDTVPLPRPVVTIDDEAPLGKALHRMRAHGIHHLVVTEAGRVTGILSDRDILARGLIETVPQRDHDTVAVDPELCVGDVMIPLDAKRDVVTQDSSLREALDLMQDLLATALPLMQGERLIGILTESDLLRLLDRTLTASGGEPSPGDRGKLVLGNPLVQNVMNLLAQAGI